jgi:hypothetical protein
MGLLFIPQMIYEYGEPQWNDTDNGNPENSRENPENHFARHKSHMD